MAELSKAAQAVLDAVAFAEPGLYSSLAAAIRAAADQVVPHEYLTGVDPAVEARQLTRLRLLAIATELENTHD
jgi:propanediol dehydratase small subunit